MALLGSSSAGYRAPAPTSLTPKPSSLYGEQKSAETGRVYEENKQQFAVNPQKPQLGRTPMSPPGRKPVPTRGTSSPPVPQSPYGNLPPPPNATNPQHGVGVAPPPNANGVTSYGLFSVPGASAGKPNAGAGSPGGSIPNYGAPGNGMPFDPRDMPGFNPNGGKPFSGDLGPMNPATGPGATIPGGFAPPVGGPTNDSTPTWDAPGGGARADGIIGGFGTIPGQKGPQIGGGLPGGIGGGVGPAGPGRGGPGFAVPKGVGTASMASGAAPALGGTPSLGGAPSLGGIGGPLGQQGAQSAPTNQGQVQGRGFFGPPPARGEGALDKWLLDMQERTGIGQDQTSPGYDSDGDGYGDVDGVTDAAAGVTDAAPETGAAVGDVLGDLFEGGANAYAGAVKGWNEGNPPPGAISPEIQAIIDQYGNSDLMSGLGSFAQQMIDPAAWEQMASNRLAQQQDAARGTLNDTERRIRDAASRGGYSVTQGGLGQAYGDYAQNMQQAERDVFNDSLANQMQAFGQAGQFGMGQQGLQQQLAQMLQGGALFDKSNEWDSYTSADEMMNALLGIGGSVAGGMGGAAGGAMSGGGGILASLLPMLMASDVNIKRNFSPVDAKEILAKVKKLSVSSWEYIDNPSVRHIGPMAQDFHAAFEVGDNNKVIPVIDANGVLLAATKALADENDELRARLDRLEKILADKE